MRKVEIKHIKPVFEDARGKIMDILEDEKVLHIGLITSTKGAIRGNHYHHKSKQFNYILKGKAELIIKDLDDPKGEIKRTILNVGDFVSIPVRMIHTIKALEDTEFLDFNTESRLESGYEEDTVRVVIEK